MHRHVVPLRPPSLLLVALALAFFCTLATAPSAGAATAGTASVVPPEEYFGLIATPQDEFGVVVPLRNGDETLGFAKACGLHNLCSVTAIVATIRGTGDRQPPSGGRVVYLAHAVGDGLDITLRVIADTSDRTARGLTPDGLPVGVITAYCEGLLRCPDAINQL